MARSSGDTPMRQQCLGQLVLWTVVHGLVVLNVGSIRADTFYAASEAGGHLDTIDPATGQTLTSLTITGTAGGLRDIIHDGQGQLLMAGWGTEGNAAPGDDVLFRLNPSTAVATAIGTITNGTDRDYWVEGMAWVNGTLYGSAVPILLTQPPTYLGYGYDTANVLIKIDPSTGHATEVGSFGADFLNVQNLAYSPQYGLIGSDIGTLDPNPNQLNGAYSSFHTTPSLIQIDPTTGVAQKIADLPIAGGLITNPFNNYLSPAATYVAGLEFSPDGSTLYGATIQTHFGGTSSGLVTIDPLTGGVTPVGTITEMSVLGIAFVVPEPSAFALLGAGFFCVAIARWRSK